MCRTKVLLVYPSPMTAESRLFRLAQALRSGLPATVTLVGKRKISTARAESVNGIGVERLGSDSPNGSVPGRIMNRLSWDLQVYRRFRNEDIDVIAAHSVWCLPVCALVASRAGAALAYNPHELETGTPTMRGKKRELARLIERRLIRRCRVVTAANEPIAIWYEREYGIPRPLTFLNMPSESTQTGSGATSESRNLRDDLDVPADALLFAHTGNLREGRHIPQILAAFEDPRTRHHIVFFGEGPLRAQLIAAARRCSRIHDGGLVPHASIVELLRSTDVAVALIDTASPSYRLSSPNKVMEAWVAEIPLLSTDLPFVRQRLFADETDRWLISDVDTVLKGRIQSLEASDVQQYKSRHNTRPPLPGSGLENVQIAYRALLNEVGTSDDSKIWSCCTHNDDAAGARIG